MRAILFILAFGFFPKAEANTHGVGNPGNALDSQLVSACEKAYNILQSDFWTGPSVPAELKDFFAVHLLTLRSHARTCRLRFTDSVYPIDLPGIEPSCARTNVSPELSNEPLDTIFISRTTCINQGIDAEAALLLVFHENIHHLVDPANSDRPDGRISDEDFCNSTASAIVNSWNDHIGGRPVKWSVLNQTPDQTQGRSHHSSLMAGDGQGDGSVVMWGGCHADSLAMFGCNRYLRSGIQFDLKSAEWTMTEPFGDHGFKPDERAHHSAVWTGLDKVLPHRMIVWGGCNGTFSCFNSLNDGAIFDPARKQWLPLNDGSVDRPSPRTFHSSVWTNQGMFIWGGLENFDSPTPGVAPKPVDGGSFWQPAASSGEESRWQKIATTGQPSPRSHHSTVFTGEDIYIWGGCKRFDLNSECVESHSDGARFNLASMQWFPLPRGGDAPSSRYGHDAFWTGTMLLIFGGENSQGTVTGGAIFSPELNKWFPMAPQPNSGAALISKAWDRDRLIGWGRLNQTSTQMFEYFPPAGDHLAFGGFWNVRPIVNVRDASSAGTFVVTPGGILHWGGASPNGEYPTDGALLQR